jgi:SAM-dependent methyltransferase
MDPRGYVVERVIVPDESKESETSPETKKLLDGWDEELRQTMGCLPPLFDKEKQLVIPRNQISEQFYSDKSIQEWALLMPSAKALFYLTHLDAKTLPSGQDISENMTRYMREMDDGIGIRSRKQIALEIVKDKLKQSSNGSQCLSLACGAADLMVEALSATNNKKAALTLVDIDDDILNLARSLAGNENLIEGQDYYIKNRNLITSMVMSGNFVDEIGEQTQLIVDAIGINEYFSDRISTKFLANAYRCVQPGGSLITANMLSNRPQLFINKIAIGWPKLYPRSVTEIANILELAGLPLKSTKIRIPEDGVYAVIEVTKPEE